MEVPKIFQSEYHFCLILWDNEPVTSTKLVALCKEKLNWSKSTTYTVIRRLAERGVVKNENAVCISLVSKQQFQESLIEKLVFDYFNNNYLEFIGSVNHLMQDKN